MATTAAPLAYVYVHTTACREHATESTESVAAFAGVSPALVIDR